jgi:hypothetical protein
MWKVATTDEFDGWFSGMGGDAQSEVIAKVDLLKLLGPQLGGRMRIRSMAAGTRT